MYFSTYHGLPIIDGYGYGGYAPNMPSHVHSIARGLPAARSLQDLVDTVDVGWILVHRDRLAATQRPPGRGSCHRGSSASATGARIFSRG